MLRVCETLPVLICALCLIFGCTACAPDIGQPLDLNQARRRVVVTKGRDEALRLASRALFGNGDRISFPQQSGELVRSNRVKWKPKRATQYCRLCDMYEHGAAMSTDVNSEVLDREWFFSAGTPINESLSRCGRFLVRQTSPSTFAFRYTALSHKNDIPIVFNVNGSVLGKKIIGTWQLQGSKRKLGPFQHAIIFAKYNTVLAMVVCSESTSHHRQGYKFSMIWSRERSLPLPILKELKSKLGAYINQGEIRMVDHGNC